MCILVLNDITACCLERKHEAHVWFKVATVQVKLTPTQTLPLIEPQTNRIRVVSKIRWPVGNGGDRAFPLWCNVISLAVTCWLPLSLFPRVQIALWKWFMVTKLKVAAMVNTWALFYQTLWIVQKLPTFRPCSVSELCCSKLSGQDASIGKSWFVEDAQVQVRKGLRLERMCASVFVCEWLWLTDWPQVGIMTSYCRILVCHTTFPPTVKGLNRLINPLNAYVDICCSLFTPCNYGA